MWARVLDARPRRRIVRSYESRFRSNELNDYSKKPPLAGLGLLSLGALTKPPSDRPLRLADALRNYGLSLGVLAPRPPAIAPSRGLIGGALGDFYRVPEPPRRTLADLYKASKQAHDSLLRVLMGILSKPGSGFDLLRADLPGWTQPQGIEWTQTRQGHVPDARAWKAYTEYVFEVETADTISIEHTRRQCELFSAYASQHNGVFVLFVPTGHEARAQRQLAAWRIKGLVW